MWVPDGFFNQAMLAPGFAPCSLKAGSSTVSSWGLGSKSLGFKGLELLLRDLHRAAAYELPTSRVWHLELKKGRVHAALSAWECRR